MKFRPYGYKNHTYRDTASGRFHYGTIKSPIVTHLPRPWEIAWKEIAIKKFCVCVKCFVFTGCQYKLLGSSSFQIPALIQSDYLQASDQVGARVKYFELLTHRCHSSIYELAVI